MDGGREGRKELIEEEDRRREERGVSYPNTLILVSNTDTTRSLS